jgi:hypothetical protein
MNLPLAQSRTQASSPPPTSPLPPTPTFPLPSPPPPLLFDDFPEGPITSQGTALAHLIACLKLCILLTAELFRIDLRGIYAVLRDDACWSECFKIAPSAHSRLAL